MNTILQHKGSTRACDIDRHRRPQRDLMAQLPQLVLPCPTPSDCEWSALVAELLENTGECPNHLAAAGDDQRRGNKRKEMKCGSKEENAKPHGTKRSRKHQQTTTLVTTVPDYDGYQWRKYGKKQIESAKYPRSYYRCTNSTDQGCPAKRTVQRNDYGDGKDGPPEYTVVYIMQHTCKMNDSVEPVILETSPQNAVALLADTTPSTSSGSTESPPISDATWNDSIEHALYEGLFADDRSPTPASLLDEIDFAGPLMSPLHTTNGWIDELLDGSTPCHLIVW